MGFDSEVDEVQRLYLAGEKGKAAAKVPDELIDRTSLIGSAGRIRERLAEWRAAEQRGSLDMMLLTTPDPAAMTLLAEEML